MFGGKDLSQYHNYALLALGGSKGKKWNKTSQILVKGSFASPEKRVHFYFINTVHYITDQNLVFHVEFFTLRHFIS